MESIWEINCTLPRFPTLSGDQTVQAAVIGGGMAGLLTAWALQEQGVQTVVLEAGRIAGGQTGKTTAKITSQHGLLYHDLIQRYGLPTAKLYGQANQEAIRKYALLCQERSIDCDFEQADAWVYTASDAAGLELEEAAAQAAGLPAALIRQVPLPFACAGAIRFQNQAQFHPLKFLSAIAPQMTIFEHTPIRKVHGQTIYTDHGTIRAENIVFACHYPIINFPGLYFTRMHQSRSYVLALENAAQVPGMFISMDKGGLSLRNYGHFLLLGGKGHRAGENTAGGQFSALETAAKKLFPACRVAARWSAQDCITPDGIPFIGRYAPGKPNWFVATGFNKWGMTSSMAAASILADLICQGSSPYEKVFSPRRFCPQNVPGTLSEVGAAVKGLSRFFSFPMGPQRGCCRIAAVWFPISESSSALTAPRKDICIPFPPIAPTWAAVWNGTRRNEAGIAPVTAPASTIPASS